MDVAFRNNSIQFAYQKNTIIDCINNRNPKSSKKMKIIGRNVYLQCSLGSFHIYTAQNGHATQTASSSLSDIEHHLILSFYLIKNHVVQTD